MRTLLMVAVCARLAAAAPAAEPLVSVTVHCDQVTGQMPALGYNMTYADGGELLLDPSNGSFRTEFVNAVREIAPAWIRFPGGTIANTYDWKRAIGPPAARVAQVHGWNDMSLGSLSSAWGPDEAARFAELAGARLLVCVPFNGTADDAADLVEYMNATPGANPNGGRDWAEERARNGHPEPYGVTQWEIGNESGGRRLRTWPAWPFGGDDNQVNGVEQGSEVARRWWAYGGDKPFTGQKAVRIDSWADADIRTRGIAGETFCAKFPPARDVAVRIGASAKDAIPWTNIVVDGAAGRITLGQVPPAGSFVFVDYTSGPHDGFVDFYRKMKAVDPSIVISESHFAMLKEAAANPERVRFDAVQEHGAGPNWKLLEGAAEDVFDEAVGRGYGGFRTAQDRWLQTLRKLGLPPETRNTISELSYSHELADDAGVDHAQTIAGALMAALICEAASRYPDIGVLGFNYLVNTHEAADAHVGPGGVVRAQGRAVEMFMRYFGQVLLKVAGDVPDRTVRWRVPNRKGGATVAETAVPKVIVTASRDGAGRVCVMVINTTKDEALPLSIRLEGQAGLAPVRAAEAWRLEARSAAVAIRAVPESELQSADGRLELVFPPASITSIRIAD